jgi:hypothetical protein
MCSRREVTAYLYMNTLVIDHESHVIYFMTVHYTPHGEKNVLTEYVVQ